MEIIRRLSDYYKRYWRHIVVFVLSVWMVAYIAGNLGFLKSQVRCLGRKGVVASCFEQEPATCRDLSGGVYGWCYDDEYTGPLPGTSAGPTDGTCSNWTWSPEGCPPPTCAAKWPFGIGEQMPYQTWGWCADPDKNRAMPGRVCGPDQGRCDNWIWSVKDCPSVCRAKIRPGQTPMAESAETCSNVCGNVNGVEIPCPPPCGEVKQETCQLTCGLVDGRWIDCPPPACHAECNCPN